ncbi:signal peptidase I [soil metagenome]
MTSYDAPPAQDPDTDSMEERERGDGPDEVTRRRSNRGRGIGRFLRDVLLILLAAVIISFLIKTFLIRSFYIPSESMEPTLYVNDRIIVNQLVPDVSPLEHGDVVVFKDPGGWLPPAPAATPGNPVLGFFDWLLSIVGLTAPDSNDHLIKRVIGLPGDHVVCCNEFGQLTVNGVPLEEPYYQLLNGTTAASELEFDVTVPDDSLWVMGDNRNNSRDSRYNQDGPTKGFVPFDNVVGRAVLISWPVSRWQVLDNYPFVFTGVEDGDGDGTAGTDQTDESGTPAPQTTTSDG